MERYTQKTIFINKQYYLAVNYGKNVIWTTETTVV